MRQKTNKQDWKQKKELLLGRRFPRYNKTGSRRRSYFWVDARLPPPSCLFWVDARLPPPSSLFWVDARLPPPSCLLWVDARLPIPPLTCFLPDVHPHPVAFVLRSYAESHVSQPLSFHSKHIKSSLSIFSFQDLCMSYSWVAFP